METPKKIEFRARGTDQAPQEPKRTAAQEAATRLREGGRWYPDDAA